jgi:hypothetical protein
MAAVKSLDPVVDFVGLVSEGTQLLAHLLLGQLVLALLLVGLGLFVMVLRLLVVVFRFLVRALRLLVRAFGLLVRVLRLLVRVVMLLRLMRNRVRPVRLGAMGVVRTVVGRVLLDVDGLGELLTLGIARVVQRCESWESAERSKSERQLHGGLFKRED